MKNKELIFHIENIADYNITNNHSTLHPLVTVLDYSKASIRDWGDIDTVIFKYGLYCIFLKDVKCGDIVYGREYYDYQAGTLVFFAPGQIARMDIPKTPYQPMGYGLIFHPDLVTGTPLSKLLQESNIFSYRTNEALHISDEERQIVLDCFARINQELKLPIDKNSKKIIAANIELFLSYCERFYDRQFISRERVNKGILLKFESLLNKYFQSEKPYSQGLPSVSYFADALHLSANYFGDLIKRETGKTVKEYIHIKLIEVAKDMVIREDKTINEIAFSLGFKYSQHFTRLFKQKVGKTPNEFRHLN